MEFPLAHQLEVAPQAQYAPQQDLSAVRLAALQVEIGAREVELAGVPRRILHRRRPGAVP